MSGLKCFVFRRDNICVGMQSFIIETDKVLLIIRNIYKTYIHAYLIDKHGVDLAKEKCKSMSCDVAPAVKFVNSARVEFYIFDRTLYIVDHDIIRKYTIVDTSKKIVSIEDFSTEHKAAKNRNVDIIHFTYCVHSDNLLWYSDSQFYDANDANYIMYKFDNDTYIISKYFACTPDIRIYFHKRTTFPTDMTIQTII
jgi:hypothetical protein